MKMLNPANPSVPVSPGGATFVAGQGVGKHGLAYAGTMLFTAMLYLRPNELFPEIFGTLSIIKFIAITALLAYTLGKLSNGEPLTLWTIEVKMMVVMVVLCLILMPLSPAPSEGWDMFNEVYSKVVLIFLLMVNLIDTRKRLIGVFNVIVAGGVWISYYALQIYMAGEQMLHAKGGLTRIAGVGGGMFGNPNDLANGLDMLIPTAIALGLSRKGVVRYLYLGCGILFSVSVLITYSRGAFLGLVASGFFMAWKFGRGKRVQMVIASAVVVGVLSVASPGGFGKRVATIFSVDSDKTGSSHQRRELLIRAFNLSLAHPFGVGLANYHIYSVDEEKAHNAYLETSVELGVLGFVAYLIINFFPFFRLRRWEREIGDLKTDADKEAYYFNVGLQGTLVAYFVCSFFASVQYYWFLYYPVAHTIAFCRIFQPEKLASETSLATATDSRPARTKGGVLWQPNYAQSGVLWNKPSQQAARNLKRRLVGRTG